MHLQRGLQRSMAEEPEAPLVVAVDSVGVAVHAAGAVEGGVVYKHKVDAVLELVVEADLCAVQIGRDL